MTDYVALTGLSVPRLDDEGKVTNKNRFYRAGETISDDDLRADSKIHKAFLSRALDGGYLREARKEETTEPEPVEGSEVNGPGADAIQTYPTPAPGLSTAAGDTVVPQYLREPSDGNGGDQQSGPKRPAKSADLETWRSYATVVGVEYDDKTSKNELQARTAEAEKAEPQDGAPTGE